MGDKARWLTTLRTSVKAGAEIKTARADKTRILREPHRDIFGLMEILPYRFLATNRRG
jgi:hypothetical protein